MPRRPSPAQVKGAVGVAVAVIVAGVVVWLAGPGDEGGTDAQGPAVGQVEPAATPSPSHSSPSPASAATTPPPRAPCDTVAHRFAPRTIAVARVTRSASVVTPARAADGVPGAPPLTRRGKSLFAWDRQQGIAPGDPAGNVLLNAHTWPDGSALGNRLLALLHRGDRIVLRGDTAQLCYRVTERVEVLAARGLPRYYSRTGPPQLAIVVCSGRRLGPGVWEKRTVWFASPAA